jgi:hypothetical protein
VNYFSLGREASIQHKPWGPGKGFYAVSYHTLSHLFKDIVQPKKRRVKRGTIRFVSTFYTIADAF